MAQLHRRLARPRISRAQQADAAEAPGQHRTLEGQMRPLGHQRQQRLQAAIHQRGVEQVAKRHAVGPAGLQIHHDPH